ncbi:CHAT domain-containing protein [Rhodofomes roseus]|uniref:CHAT domain-containing protein n=1 Tax=Rhodofomes roseus TaxID=34475 RepID=A0ABQ8K248_9APHY|nr:CHAT domain-containing protein [Rhodofomes roseus]KAH9830580.1 CHAT domain-containing protein [Rhodofomes roseus]
MLYSLGAAYMAKFQAYAYEHELGQAIVVYEEAVQLTPDKAERAQYLFALASALESRSEMTGNISDIETTITLLSEALELIPKDQPERYQYVHKLGHVYHSCFDHTHDLSHIEKCILTFQEAVELCGVHNIDASVDVSHLGDAYRHRFLLLGEIADLKYAVELLEKAKQLCSQHDHDRPTVLMRLGTAYAALFEQERNVRDLHKTIETFKEVIALMPAEHLDRSPLLNNLGAAYLALFIETEDTQYMDLAIETYKVSLSLLPEGHSNRRGQLSNLGNVYSTRFMHQHELSDNDAAIAHIKLAVDLTPEGHSFLPVALANLGNAYLRRYVFANDQAAETQSLQQAVSYFRQAACCGCGTSSVRLLASFRWADQAKRSKTLEHECIDGYNHFFTLLPEVVWLGKTVAQQHKDIAIWNEVAPQAAAAAIRLGKYSKAIEWLEQGRSVTWNQLLQLRSPYDDLANAYPLLSDELKSVSQQLEMLGHDREHEHAAHHHDALEEISQLHRKLAARRDAVVKEIRTLPSFENFLQLKPFRELLEAAKESPIVLLVAHQDGCHADALILIPNHDSVIHMHLEDLSIKELQGMQKSMLGYMGGHSQRSGLSDAERAAKMIPTGGVPMYSLHDVLSKLWTKLVSPILKKLSSTFPVRKAKTHLWWCVTGVLSFLPLHAAGDYSITEPGHKISDYVVSSYTPTLTALIKARQKVVEAAPTILAICETHAKGYPTLPGVIEEQKAIEDLAVKAQVYSCYLQDSEGTKTNVLDKLPTASWLHMACHGVQDSENPLNSAFILHDGTLQLSQIIQQNLGQADFAFLSACQTAAGDLKLSDQAVHLAAGMLFAGFRTVIATMWSIKDEDGPEVARDVYAHLLDSKDSTQAGYALHKAVQNLRKKYTGTKDEDLLAWVPFIHIGC